MSAVASATAVPDAIRRELVPEDLLAFRWLGEVALDPGGRRVAYTVREVDAAANGYRTDLFVRELDGEGTVRVSAGAGNAGSPSWSADGQRLAYGWSDAEGSTVRVWSAASGETEAFALGDRPLTGLAWSPDGRRLAGVRWTSQRHARERGPQPGIPAPDIRVVRRLRYKQDGVGFVHDRFAQIWVLELESGELVQVTDSECDYSEPAWSGVGDRLAFVGMAREQDRALGQGQLFVSAYPGGAPELLMPEWVGACRSPAWGDDDRHIAFAGHQHPAPTNRRIFMTPHLAEVASGTARELGDLGEEVGNYAVSDSRAGLSNITVAWPRGDRWIYFLLTVEGTTQLCRIDTESVFERLVAEPAVAFDYSPAAGDLAAYGKADPSQPGDLFLWSPEGSRRLTVLNPWLGDRALAVPEERYFEGIDGAQIHGWLMKPPDFDPTKRYPTIVYVHCSMFSFDFSHEFQCLVGAGYVLNYFNVRGTTAGYGRAWTRASEGDQGGEDFRETMLGIDDLVAQPYVDETRLGVTGGSCGGFMTNWIVGHTDRFAAAVTQRSITNQISFFGTSDIGPEGTVGETGTHGIENLDAAWRQSPIAYAADITTPLLILHSDEDHRCPLEQAEQLFATLRWLGREVEMVVFEGENHGLSRAGRPGNRIERIHRILDWFGRHLRQESP
jgi:dipeptidyl aminopeptidase/acylaminoacyl peptidase